MNEIEKTKIKYFIHSLFDELYPDFNDIDCNALQDIADICPMDGGSHDYRPLDNNNLVYNCIKCGLPYL